MVVTHPFHPLSGQRLRVLFERRRGGGRVLVCEGGPSGTVTLAEDATDRAEASAERALTFEGLVAVCAVVAALER